MTKRHPLWDELEKQKALLEEQEDRLYQQLKLLADAVMSDQIADWPEVENLLFEMIEFGDYYRPAWELFTQLKKYIGKNFSSDVQRESGFLKAIIEDAAKGEK